MNGHVISVENLSKLYKIGGLKPGYDTLRDRIVDAVQSPFKRAYGLLRGDNYAAADLSDTLWALKDINFDVSAGEVIGIIGNNGAGKSTLLKILAKITEPTTGRALIRGRVGSLLEVGTGFHPELSGRENVYLNGSILGMRRSEIDQKFDAIVEFSGVEKFIDTPTKLYSSGMQVRLAFSVAAHLEPEILLVDEVLAVGDAAFQKKCLGKMKEVTGEGRTVLYVSHNMTSVISLCDRVLLIDEGRITQRGNPTDIVNSYLGMNRSITSSEMDLVHHPGRTKDAQRIFQHLSIEDMQGKRTELVKVGDSFVINLEIDTGPIEIQVPQIQVNILDRNRTSVAKLRNHIMNPSSQSLAGKYHARIVWEKCNLAPGIYSINLRIRNGLKMLDRILEVISFQVQPADYYKSGVLDLNPGLTIPDGYWEINAIDHE